jgi:hypothetical protein
MKRFSIHTNATNDLLEMEQFIVSQHDLQPDEEYEIDVFDTENRLVHTIRSNTTTH